MRHARRCAGRTSPKSGSRSRGANLSPISSRSPARTCCLPPAPASTSGLVCQSRPSSFPHSAPDRLGSSLLLPRSLIPPMCCHPRRLDSTLKRKRRTRRSTFSPLPPPFLRPQFPLPLPLLLPQRPVPYLLHPRLGRPSHPPFPCPGPQVHQPPLPPQLLQLLFPVPRPQALPLPPPSFPLRLPALRACLAHLLGEPSARISAARPVLSALTPVAQPELRPRP